MTNRKELLKWEAEVKSVLHELKWKLIKAERALYVHNYNRELCAEKLQADWQRAEETSMALQFLSKTHPLRNKCEDDLYKTEIRIFRLENRLKRFSSLKLIQMEIKKAIILEEINYYEGVLKSIRDLLNPPVVLRRISNTPDGEAERNPMADEEMILPDYALPDKLVRLGSSDCFISLPRKEVPIQKSYQLIEQ